MSAYPAASFLKSAHSPGQFVPDEGMEVAFAGRSNAGKSSALNAIVGRRQFARVSRTPGRTQLVNFFALDDAVTGGRRLVDLPGYGFARVPEAMQRHWRRLMEGYFTDRRALTGLMLVVDSRRGLMDYDRQMLAWAAGARCPVHVLLTKADKLSRGVAARTLAEVRRELEPSAGSVQLFSALARQGVEEARQALEALMPAPDATLATPRPIE
ncbi:MAG: YihA family ribosome biogenesis GTP-binding protein [Gammaproteobacteria bacterium]|nr:YihA family ribosome biogenesis GTP-binding protein [Gammaproteobacteria bacterium]TVQ47908.1 MAG: YihA family ribosome biogenesis GTP-binding protein [Gammaproteobacteria bacterium]